MSTEWIWMWGAMLFATFTASRALHKRFYTLHVMMESAFKQTVRLCVYLLF